MNHEWVDDFGSPWHGQADDVCAVCAQPPAAHKEPQPDLVDRKKLLAGLAVLRDFGLGDGWAAAIDAAIDWIEDFEG